MLPFTGSQFAGFAVCPFCNDVIKVPYLHFSRLAQWPLMGLYRLTGYIVPYYREFFDYIFMGLISLCFRVKLLWSTCRAYIDLGQGSQIQFTCGPLEAVPFFVAGPH